MTIYLDNETGEFTSTGHTSRIFPAQASLEHAGWTVTVTHMHTTTSGMLEPFHTWAASFGIPTMEGRLVLPMTTSGGTDPNPLEALEIVGAYLPTSTLPELAGCPLAGAIAAMYGEEN